MNRYRLIGQRLAALAFITALLLNYPLISLFNADRMILGAPVLHVYLFSVWLTFIGLMAFFIERRE
ncbi:MAG TPA: hypothetical protein EYP25_11645 [Anaerolineae bacterium]|nr:hypothetical protein [Caldilineae bacterium]HID35196.1 hypothetical protein [Anaerolineae bacterium]HIQ12478.1 hypothetical protein [Caldilineales bacterium]